MGCRASSLCFSSSLRATIWLWSTLVELMIHHGALVHQAVTFITLPGKCCWLQPGYTLGMSAVFDSQSGLCAAVLGAAATCTQLHGTAALGQ
jgi:hypothetical protein